MQNTASLKEIENFQIRKGDILLTKDSEVPEEIGTPSVVTEEIDNLVCGYHLYLLRPKNSIINSEYICWALRSFASKKYFYQMANGSTRFGLNIQLLKDCLIPLPKLDEQKRIVKILSNLEKSISIKENKIYKTQNLLNSLRKDLISNKK